jgi:hypothetical protein
MPVTGSLAVTGCLGKLEGHKKDPLHPVLQSGAQGWKVLWLKLTFPPGLKCGPKKQGGNHEGNERVSRRSDSPLDGRVDDPYQTADQPYPENRRLFHRVLSCSRAYITLMLDRASNLDILVHIRFPCVATDKGTFRPCKCKLEDFAAVQ